MNKDGAIFTSGLGAGMCLGAAAFSLSPENVLGQILIMFIGFMIAMASIFKGD